jgi:hypothetical protein
MTDTLTPPADLAAVRRRESVAILRAVADLIETRPDLPEPDATIRIHVSGYTCDVPAALTAITAALPGPWTPKMSRSGTHEWLDLTASAAGSSNINGTTVHLSAPARDACEPSGTRTITTWQPLPAVAALIADPAALEEEL